MFGLGVYWMLVFGCLDGWLVCLYGGWKCVGFGSDCLLVCLVYVVV